MKMKPYYQHGGITIYHGNCAEVIPSLPLRCIPCACELLGDAVAIHLAAGHDVAEQRFDLLLTDPPYGLGAARRKFAGHGVKTHRSGLAAGKCIKKRDYGDSGWDDKPADPAALALSRERSEWQIIFGGNYFDLPKAKCWLIWDKLRGETDYADGEMAWTNLDKAIRIIRWRWNGFLTENADPRDERVHPTQKPFAVMHWAIRQAPATVQSILDPWVGSGTTLLAAKQLSKVAVGIEIDEAYCEVAAKRLSQEVFAFGGETEPDSPDSGDAQMTAKFSAIEPTEAP
jgi:site-specific DNA-methyltransferase (adenine-specific)